MKLKIILRIFEKQPRIDRMMMTSFGLVGTVWWFGEFWFLRGTERFWELVELTSAEQSGS